MIKINKSLDEVIGEISELKHIEESSEKSNVNIRTQIKSIINNCFIRIEFINEYDEYSFKQVIYKITNRLLNEDMDDNQMKKHEVEDLFIKSKLICKENEVRTIEYKNFIEKISEVKSMIEILNQMYNQGYYPDSQFLENINLSTMKGQSNIILSDKIKGMRDILKGWKISIQNLLKNINLNNFENYYLNFFLGDNLVKINKTNLINYLKFIDSKIVIENLVGLESK